MDHSGHHMGMGTSTTMTAAAASSTSMSMEGMHSHGGGMGGCKVNMLWNWDTIDACFLTSSWRITTQAIFAGTCIGVILLAMTLMFLRRAQKEYDAFLIRKHDRVQAEKALRDEAPRGVYRPTALEQAVRALLYTLQFANAYFIMLLAMYYNGYIIVCIFIGAFLGSFIFTWHAFGKYDDYSCLPLSHR